MFFDRKLALLMWGFFLVLLLSLPITLIMELHQEKTVYGEVVTVEHRSFFIKHTVVEMKTYSGESVTVQFQGYTDFKLGKSYKITTKGVWYKQLYPSIINHEEISNFNGEGGSQ